MKKLLLSIILLASLSVLSQSEYPKLYVLNNDTFCLLTIDQVNTVNVSFVRLDGCNMMVDTLNKLVLQQDVAIKHYQELSNEQDNKMLLQQRILAEQDKQIGLYDKEAKKNKRKIKWLKFQRNALAVVAAVLAVKIFVL
jgi:hypothetical protein